MASQNGICIAVDFGGTKLMIGAVGRSGEILASETWKTGFQGQREAADCLLKHLDSFLRARRWGGAEIAAAGMGLVGQIDHGAGIWHKMYGLEGDGPIPIAAIVSSRCGGIPCAVDNDVKAALMAELKHGGNRKCDNFAYINVGTGIAAGFVVDGRVVRGHGNDAGEIGHYVVRLGGGTAGGLGERSSVEMVASGLGMFNRFQRLAAESSSDEWVAAAREPGFDTAKLFALADAGNPLALRVTEDAADAIADMLVNVFGSYSPEVVVFGGGVFRDGWMYQRVMDRLPERIRKSAAEIRISALDLRTIGLIGAAELGFAGLKEEKMP